MNLLRRGPKAPVEPPPLNLSTEAVRHNLLSSSSGTWAWFRLAPVRWSFRSPDERAAILDDLTLRWAELAGRLVHMRVTSHPVAHMEWARNLDRNSPNRLADVDGAESWDEYLEAGQLQIIGSGLETPAVYMGVQITGKKLSRDDLARITSERRAEGLSSTLEGIKRELVQVTETMSREGFNASPVTERELGWLLHASVGLGADVADSALAANSDEGWNAEELASISDSVRAYARPLSGTVTMTTSRDGAIRTHHAAFMTVSRFEVRDTLDASRAPWMAFSQRFPYPVEWSAILRVLHGRERRGSALFDKTRANSIREHYVGDHGELPPPEVERAIELAAQIEDEVTNGPREVATRVAGPIRMAVFGTTEDEALARVRDITSTYAGGDQRIEVDHPLAQYALYREFIPGEEHLEHRHHVRMLPAAFVATSVPNASSRLGDDQGAYLGQGIGSCRGAVMFDPCYGPSHPLLNASGLSVIATGLGGGKSTLAGDIAENFSRGGKRTIILDPSGPLARLTRLPHLAARSRHVNLSGAEPGTLNPYRLVPVPLRTNYDTEKEHQEAIREAEAERRDLMIDTATMLLTDPRPDYLGKIAQVVGEEPGDYGLNPWRIVVALEERHGHLGYEVGQMLRQAAGLKGGRLIFPESADEPEDALESDDAILTVITMPGLTPPAAGTDRTTWTRSERMAVVMLHLAARYAQRAMYADRLPKVIIVDEGGIAAAAGSSFQTFVLRAARDSRKHNTFFALLIQNPGDALAVSPEIHNLIGTAFIGRLKGIGTAQAALQLLDIPLNHGYERVLLGLRPGEFVMRDYDGNVDVMRVDLSHRPALLAALNTTPTRAADAVDQLAEPFEMSLAR